MSCISLRPFRILLHHNIDTEYIDINITLYDPERNLTTTTDKLPAASGRGRLVTLWILSGLVALAFIAASASKLAGAVVMVELFDKVGLGQWFRYFTGLLEVAAGIGLLTSSYALYAAVLLAIVMAGAIIAHVTVLGSSPAAPAVLFVLSGIIAYLRKPQNINQQRTRT